MSSTTAAARLTPSLPYDTGVRGWLTILSPRDRVIYGVLLSVMLWIIGIYMVLAVRLLFTENGTFQNMPLNPTTTPETAQIDVVDYATTSTMTPLAIPSPYAPVDAPLPASNPASPPGLAASATPAFTSSPASIPTDTPVEQVHLTLYFADSTETILIAVTRLVPVVNHQMAEAALRELLAGPSPASPLKSPLAPDVQVLNVEVHGDTLTVNFNRSPGNDQSMQALVLTLTEPPAFRNIGRVQLQVNGSNIGLNGNTGSISRPVLNPDNPQSLSTAYNSGTRFLPLYFLSGSYRTRITRLVPRTSAVAQATIEELLRGPGDYSNLLTTPIPPGTQLRSIQRQGNQAIVDLTAAFANAPDRRAALDSLLLSIAELRDSNGEPAFQQIEVLLDGRPLDEFWGPGYAGVFQRPVLNPE